MLAPLFLAVAQIFMWALTLAANELWANEYVTTGLVLASVIVMLWTGLETWQFALAHVETIDNEGEDDENN